MSVKSDQHRVILAALAGIPDIQEAMASKQAELQALGALEECLAFEQSVDLSMGIPSGEVLQALIANKVKQLAALNVLDEGGEESKEADYGTNFEKSLTEPLDQAEIVAKNSDPGHKAYWQDLVKKAWGSLVALRNGAPPAAGGALNYEAAMQNLANRIQNEKGANPQEMNELRMFLKDFPSLYKTDASLLEFGKKTFAQKDPNKIPQAKKALELFANIIDMAGKIDRWKGPNFLQFVNTLRGYTNNFRNAYNALG